MLSQPIFTLPRALNLDRATHAAIGRFTQGLSPAALSLAYADWWLHLAMSPGKQLQLAEKAQRKTAKLARAALTCAQAGGAPCIEPLEQDDRFTSPAWQAFPYNLMYQSFLLGQQWWHNATTEIPGLSPHHQEVVTFAVRQWLDMFSPSNFWLSNPEVQQATWREGGANLARGLAKFVEDWMRSQSGEPNPQTQNFRPGHEVAITPGQVVLRNDLIELIQYAPATAQVHAEPILILPSWIMKYYILDLSPHNSLVRYLVAQGHTVFMVSWRNPGQDPHSADSNLGMDDYLRLGPLAALDAVSTICPQRKVHAVGYCLGGTLMAIAAAKLAREDDPRIASLSLLAAQTDFEEPGELSLFIDSSQVAWLEDLMKDQGYLDGQQMGGTFMLLRSRDLVWSRMVRAYLLGLDEPLNDLLAWNQDTTRLPYRMHSEHLRNLYLNNELAHGLYRVDGKPVALNDIEVPLFVVGTVKDHVSPWRSVYKINLLTETEITFVLTSGGHNAGIVSEPGHPGRTYQMTTRHAQSKYTDPDTWQATAPHADGSWWPAWHQWLAARSTQRITPPSLGAPASSLPAVEAAPGSYVHMR